MNKLFAPFLPPWAETGLQPAFYDLESGTVLQQTARMYDKVNQLIRLFNELSEETRTTVEEYIAKFVELKDFVDNYFDNLDVQEEINNKLNAMAEDGTLQEIIASYLQANVAWTFDTVADMQASENLIAGSYAQTLGFYSIGDGGASLYKITDTGTADGMTVIAIGSLYANLVFKDCMSVKQFGAVGNGTTDDSVAIQTAINNSALVEGNLEETYLADTTLLVEDKHIKNLNIKASAYEYDGVNEQHEVFRITGDNEFTNVSVESEFVYEPSIQAKTDPTVIGLASNVKAFACSNTNTNFYGCKTNHCYAYWISNASNVNVYDAVSINSESNFVLTNTSNKLRVFNGTFTIDKAVNSGYYHHVYLREGSEAEFNNCEFTETGSGNIGNHYHAYSTSVTSETVVNKKLVFNNCTLITTVLAGQINCANLYVNGGFIKADNFLAGGDFVEKANAYFNNVTITLENARTDTFYFARTGIFFNNCEISYAGTGHIQFSTIKYELSNTKLLAPSAQLSCAVSATTTSHATGRIIIDGCYFDVDTVAWCYPFYADDVRITNTTYNLHTTKSNTNPADRDTSGYLYNCVFNNWATPLNANSSNTLKYSYISAGVAKTNTTTS